MKVKDVILSALSVLGRRDIAALLKAGGTLTAGDAEVVETLLYCFNATEDELARKYFPLVCTDTVISSNGEFNYTIFLHAPVKINKVIADGKEVEFELFPKFMRVDAKKITVEFEYAPAKKTIDGDSDFGSEVGEYLLALGSVAEYCLINGETEAAEIWEEKYRRHIDGAQKRLPSGGTIPPRRWI